ncbi:putative amidase (plasmid) [Phenylobacterium zucineum HLK1]|uniref:Putative amidase n=1 Tax=Phenylobacterium zucineum (strain HLK1) TaxID=450851 RepID=B4RIS6_PHEZH|nr:amidase [Phenylobacterium zucineum]ACG80251.1 putative amidase [Phenylobacterium zucineum HLK1]
MDFRKTTIEALVGDIRARKVSAREVTAAALANVEATRQINAVCELAADRALSDAAVLDARLKSGDAIGPLAGVPLLVKDLEDAVGLRTTFGSALHVDAPPASGDSALVRRLKAAGAVVVGKANTPAFGFKGVTENLPFGVTRNPWNTDYHAGGSSGGSAAGVAAGIVPLATGSDGGGSIRIPAAVCGFSGIKTTQGQVPVGGASAPGSGILTVKGPMALRVRDTALALDASRGPDPEDAFSLHHDGICWRAALDADNLPRKVVWSPTMGFARVDREILARCGTVVDALANAGVAVVERQTVWSENPLSAWYVIWAAQRARTQGHLKGSPDWERIDPDLRMQIEDGLRFSAPDYANALHLAHSLAFQLNEAIGDADVLLTPTLAGHPPAVGQEGTIDGEPVGTQWVQMTPAINMTRNPAGAAPIGNSAAGLPMSLQVIGRHREDVRVLKTMCWLEDLLQPRFDAPFGVA